MRNTRILLALVLGATALAATAGCNRSSEETPSVSVPGPDSQSSSDESQDHAQKPRKPDQDPSHPVVLIETTLGTITVRLEKDKAPLTVDNFLTYVAAKYYDQTIFHQVTKDYPKIILGGAYMPEMVEKKARIEIRNEADNGLRNRRGTIAMARRRDHQDTATCHFFINLGDNDVLDYKARTARGYGYCVFGEVTGDESFATIDRIGQVPVHDVPHFERSPVENVVIKSIRQIR